MLTRTCTAARALVLLTAALLAFATPATLAQAPYRWTNFVGLPGGPGSADGLGSAAQFYFPTGVAVDGFGNIYVADADNQTIRKITLAGVVTTLAGSPGAQGSANGTGSAARFAFPNALAADGLGNVYVADTDNHTIRKITSAGVVTTLAGSPGVSGSANGTGSAARFAFPRGVAVDGNGNVYVGDTENYTVRKITPAGVVTTLAGSAGFVGSSDGTGAAARFSELCGVAVDGAGNVYVADTGNSLVRKITPGGVVTTLAGSALQPGSLDGTGSAAHFNNPVGITVDGNGQLYVADTGNNTIRKVTAGGVVTTLAGTALQSGSTDGTGSAARFYRPTAVAFTNSSQIYVADYYNNTVRKLTAAGVVTTLAGQAPSAGSADGTGQAARFATPSGLAVDASRNVYVADRLNQTIRKVTPAGTVTTLAGSPGTIGSADGPGGSARFYNPRAVAVDAAGSVYVADRNNHTIRKIAPGGEVTTLAGSAGELGHDDGLGSVARFRSPSGVAVDGSGNVYVGDAGNHTIRKITPAGVVSTLAGVARTFGSADGAGSAARFYSPEGVAVDASGNVYVADFENSTIRKVTPTGVVSTLAGSAEQLGSTDGTGAAARFFFPQAVAVDASGNVYVVEGINHGVRKVTPGGVVTTIGGSADLYGSAEGVGSAARFHAPEGIAALPDGRLFVANSTNEHLFVGLTGPEIDVQQPTGTALEDGNAIVSAGTVFTDGSSVTLNFAIVNQGTADLTGLAVTISGTHAGDFSKTDPAVTMLGASLSTSFTVTFTPQATGVRTALLRVGSNDGDEAQFDITLTGSGAVRPPPAATTGGATGVTLTTATLNGVVNPNGTATSATFEYGTTTSYGSTIAAAPAPGSGSAPVNVSANLTGLASGQQYHFRLVATSSAGTTNGADVTFTTGATAPAAATGTASGVTATGATLNATVNPNGSATTALFQYGTTTSYGSSVNVVTQPGSGVSPVGVDAPVSGLLPNQTYHFRVQASNAGGTTDGADATFTTATIVPTVTTLAETNVGAASATLHATVNPNGAATGVRFHYGPAGNINTGTLPDIAIGSGRSAVNVMVTINGLTPSTAYEFFAEATNAAGTAQGAIEPFSTNQSTPPPDASNDVAFVAQNTIVIDVLDGDTPVGGLQLLQNGLSGAAVSEGRAFVTGGQAVSFRPKLPNQLVNRETPFETLTYTVQNGAGADSAQVKVYYFTGLRGTYRQANLDFAGSGRAIDLRLTLTPGGLFTGKLNWDGEEYALDFEVDQKGRVQIEVPKRSGDGTLVANLSLQPSPPLLHRFVGTFEDTSTAAPLQAAISLDFVPPSDAAPSGLLVTFIDPSETVGVNAFHPGRGTSILLPEGIGFARIKPRKTGLARFQTTMPDYASFKKSYALKAATEERSAFYDVEARPYGRNGGIVKGDAEVSFEIGVGADVIGAELDWVRVEAAGSRRTANAPGAFVGGFDIAALLRGFSYLMTPGGGVPPGFDPQPIGPNATLTLSGGRLDPSPIRYPLTIMQSRGEQAGPPDTAGAPMNLGLKLKFKLRQAFFSGSFIHPESGKRTRFMGAVSSQEKRAKGTFLSPTFPDGLQTNRGSGSIVIEPRDP